MKKRLGRILLQVLWSFATGGGVAILLLSLGAMHFATPIPFILLLPGEVAFMLSPDSHFDLEGQVIPYGPVSVTVLWVVNILFYTVLAYLVLHFLIWRRTPGGKDNL